MSGGADVSVSDSVLMRDLQYRLERLLCGRGFLNIERTMILAGEIEENLVRFDKDARSILAALFEKALEQFQQDYSRDQLIIEIYEPQLSEIISLLRQSVRTK